MPNQHSFPKDMMEVREFCVQEARKMGDRPINSKCKELVTAVKAKFKLTLESERIRKWLRSAEDRAGRGEKKSPLIARLIAKAEKMATLEREGVRISDIEKALEDYEGYELYQSRDNWGKKIVGVFPAGLKDSELPEKDYEVFQGKNGVYNAFRLPGKQANVYPISDVHLGHHAFDGGRFREYLARIKADPDGWIILHGDLVDNALFDSVGGSIYESSAMPDSQLEAIVKLLAPVSNRILLSVSGNHESRTRKKVSIDIGEWIAAKLKVPYRKDLMFADLLVGDKRFSVYVWHGASNSMTNGGKLNAAERPSHHVSFSNFYLSGHVHAPVVQPHQKMVADPETLKVDFRTEWTVINGAMLKYMGTYASEKSWAPPCNDFVRMQVYDTGEYSAGFIDK